MVSLSGWAEDSAPVTTPPKTGIIEKIKQFFSNLHIEWMPEEPNLSDSGLSANCLQTVTPAFLQAENQYEQEIYERLLPKWNFLAQYSGPKPVFSIKTARNGQIVETRLLKSSGDSAIDAQALAGVNQLSLPELPADFPLSTMETIASYESVLYDFGPLIAPANKEESNRFFSEVFPPWLTQMRRKSLKYWRPPVNVQGNHQITIQVKLDPRTGQIFQRNIIKSSCNSKVDQSALEALDRANPLPPLPMDNFPSDLPRDIFDVRINFSHSFWST